MRLAWVCRYDTDSQIAMAPELPVCWSKLADQGHSVHMFGGFVSRQNPLLGTLLFYATLPWTAFKMRTWGAEAVFFAEALPLVALFFKLVLSVPAGKAYGDRFGLPPWLSLSLDRIELPHMSALLCRGETVASDALSRGAQASRVAIIRDCAEKVSLSSSEAKRKLEIPEEYMVFLYAGRLAHERKLDMLLQSWTYLVRAKKMHPLAHLYIVGVGPAEPELRKLVVDSDRVVFRGWVPEVLPYHAAADVVVAMRAPDLDGNGVMPGSLLRGMACGSIVIAADCSGSRELVIHGVNGFLFSSSITSISNCLLHAATAPDLKLTMGSAAACRVSKLTPKQLGYDYANLVAQMANL